MAAMGLIAASFITVIYCIWVYNFYRLKKGRKPLSLFRPLTPEEKRKRLEALHRAEAEMEREDEEWWKREQEEKFWAWGVHFNASTCDGPGDPVYDEFYNDS